MLQLLLAPLVIMAVFVANPFFTTNELQDLGFSHYESINPNSLIYPLKQLSEKVQSMMISDQAKGQFYVDLTDKRFNELVFTLNSQKTGFMDETIGRYNSAVGQLKASYPQAVDKNKTAQKIKILEMLRDRYHSGTGHWVNIQQTVDTTSSLL